jgi:hypothetical protein
MSEPSCYLVKEHKVDALAPNITSVNWCKICTHGASIYNFDKAVYNVDYARIYDKYKFSPINAKLHEFRRRFTIQNAPPGDYPILLDFGCATGEFCRKVADVYDTHGYDVNTSYTDAWRVDETTTYSTKLADRQFDVVTFFDSLEHVHDPLHLITYLNPGAVIVSIPMMDRRSWVNSKHLKPKEHLHYFTSRSLLQMFSIAGYVPVMFSQVESQLGREKITTYAFRKRK